MSGQIYTVGDGTRTQIAQREDGVWFTRSIYKGRWLKWTEYGRRKPYAFGMYIAPHAGKAVLPCPNPI